MVPVLLLSGHQGHPTHTYTTRTSSIILPKQGEGATLRSAASIDGVGQLSHSHDTKISFSKIPLMMESHCDEILGASLPHSQLHIAEEV